MKVSVNLIVGAVALTATAAIVFMVFRKGKTIAQAAGALVDSVNPVNPANVFAKSADFIVQGVTGDSSASLGSFLYDKFSGDTSGKVATAPTYPRGNVIQISDYWKNVESDDQERGRMMREAVAFDDTAFQSNEGGAPFGNPLIMRQGVRYGATRLVGGSAQENAIAQSWGD